MRALGPFAAAVLLAGSTTWAADPPEGSPPDSIGGVVETVHGYVVRDPFRGLEDRGGADAWIRARNARTEAWWDAHPDPALDARLEALYALDRVGRPRVAGSRTFFVHQSGSKEQATLVVAGDGGDRTLVDPNAVDPGGRTALDWYHPSDDGRLVAYGLSKDGTEDSVLRVIEVETRRDLGVAIPDTRWCDLSWLPDASGFYYTRYPPKERYASRVRFHRLGSDPAKDPVVFGDGLEPVWFPWALVSEDGRHVALTTHRGWSASDVVLEERATGKRRVIAEPKENEITYPVRVAGGVVWAVTNRGAPRYRLVRIAPGAAGAAGADEWTDVLPEGEHALSEAVAAGDRFVAHLLDAGASRLVVVEPGGARRDVTLPQDLVEIGGLDADPKGSRFVCSYTSFDTPSTLVEGDAATAAPVRTVATVRAAAAADFRVERVRYPSSDGTAIPLRIVARTATGPRGPTLLTGYGGFSVSAGPGFSATALAWVERGGVFCEPNLRGGSEFGEPWHLAGTRERKPQVFDDFEHAMRWLIAEGRATPSSIAIHGGSNGGLLVGAMTTRCPELFAAAAGAVGLYDMVRYHHWPPADIWADEFGSAVDARQTGYLLGYSPYHQVRKGVAYPAFLGTTGEQDERVSWRHTAKFVAALEAATSSRRPVLFHMETKVGHGQGKPRSERAREASRIFRFLWANAAGSS